MKIYDGEKLREHKRDLLFGIKHKRNFVSKIENYIEKEKATIMPTLVLCGLRGTGKTVGILQALPDDACYIVQSDEDDESSATDYKSFVEENMTKYSCFVFDEFAWIKDLNTMIKYLMKLYNYGVKVIIAATEGFILQTLCVGKMCHRTYDIYTTNFDYDEFLRIEELTDPFSKEVFKTYLEKSGIFSYYLDEKYGDISSYVDEAIISNLERFFEVSRRRSRDYDELREITCKILSKAFLQESTKTKFSLVEADVLNLFDRSGIVFRVRNIFNKDMARYYSGIPRLYYELFHSDMIDTDGTSFDIGHSFEGVVLRTILEFAEVYFGELRLPGGTNYEVDAVFCMNRTWYIVECKAKDSKASVSQNSSFLRKEIDEELKELYDYPVKRFVVYNGPDCVNSSGQQFVSLLTLKDYLEKESGRSVTELHTTNFF